MTARKSRATESRNNTARGSETPAPQGWQPPSTLDAPPPREGMGQRWVATSILGKDTPSHYAKRLREGWAPRPADTVPADFPTPTIEHGKYAGYVGIEGMILMEMPLERIAAREEYYRGKTSEQTQSVQAALGKFATAEGRDIKSVDSSSVERGKLIVMDDEDEI